MKIAVVTGASSGMGREFVYQIAEKYPYLEEIWVISRSEISLMELKEELHKVRILPLDITKKEALLEIEVLLREKEPDIQLLVQAAGAGIQKNVEEIPLWELSGMVELNCTALTRVLRLCLPFCKEGSRILCLASSMTFLPQPGFAVYAASKSYVLSFSRALNRELRGRCTVTAVCPGPVNTPFLEKMGGREKMPKYKKAFIADPKAVVRKALRDSERGRAVSIYGTAMKALHIACKIFPHRFLLHFV